MILSYCIYSFQNVQPSRQQTVHLKGTIALIKRVYSIASRQKSTALYFVLFRLIEYV